jgi:hypothetical protein
VRAGKLAAGVAKGSLAGPLGIAAALWENRRSAGMVLISAAILSVLPLLFLLLLPSLVFGGLENAFDPENPDRPILADSAAVIRNINAVSSGLNAIMLESLDELYGKIDRDFESSGGDTKVMTNPYEAGAVIDANLIICQYSAKNDKDFIKISISDLEEIVRENKDEIFSFEKEVEIVTYTAVDEDTGETYTYTETVITYTVIYNGDEHFADNIFSLTEEQKILALERKSPIV